MRETRNGKEDMRQRRSRQHLSSALLGLMEEQPYGEISVVDICQRAMVHRTTFYAHFEDKDDLFRYVLQSLMDQFSESWDRAGKERGFQAGIRDEFQKVLEFFKAHQRLCTVGLGGSGSPQLQMMEKAIARVLERFILEQGGTDPQKDPYAAKVWSRFYAGAVLSAVDWWLENDTPVSTEEMVSLLGRTVPEHWA